MNAGILAEMEMRLKNREIQCGVPINEYDDETILAVTTATMRVTIRSAGRRLGRRARRGALENTLQPTQRQ